MANEAVRIAGETYINPVMRTCAEATSISAGTILALTDPNTVAATSTAGEAFGGIAAADKKGGDGSTTIAAYMDGVFDLTMCSGAAVQLAGGAVRNSGANQLCIAQAGDLLSGALIGYLEEDVDGLVDNLEQVRVRLRGN